MAQSVQSTMAQGGIKVNILSSEMKPLLTKYRAREHQMLMVYWGPDYMDPHTNADGFAHNLDNSDAATSGKPLAWRNSWEDDAGQQDDGSRRARARRGQARADVHGPAEEGAGRGSLHHHVPVDRRSWPTAPM